MKHFSEEDITKLKEQEKGGGCLLETISNLVVFFLVAVVIVGVLAVVNAGQQPGLAVSTTATAIYGPTGLVLSNTPTLAPTVTRLPALAVEAAPATVGAVPASTWMPPATYTPLPTYTPMATHTAAPTYTPPPTWTALPTWTPAPTWTPPAPHQVIDYAADWQAARTAAIRLTWLSLALFGLAAVGLLFAVVRPNDSHLRRLYRLLEMHLLTILAQAGMASPTAPAAPVRALPAPVRTTPLHEWQRSRVAPVRNTGVTGVTGAAPVQNTGATPAPGVITVSVQPTEPVIDAAVLEGICSLWNEMSARGERPSMNRVCFEYFGSKNSDRLAIVNRAIKWGRGEGIIPPLPTSKTRKPT